MDGLNFIDEYLADSIVVKQKLAGSAELKMKIMQLAEQIEKVFLCGNKVLIAGNGGSAGDSQHIAAEFVSRFMYDRPGLPAIALTTDTSMLTAIGNDYGFEKLFSRQVQAQGVKGDIFIGISTSGNSKNVMSAVEEASKKGLFTVALCGSGGKLRTMVDLAICAPSESTPFIQECHIVIGHVVCAIVEEKMFPRDQYS